MKVLLKIIMYLLIPFLYMTITYIFRQYDATNSLAWQMTLGNTAVFALWIAYGVWIITKTTYTKLIIKLN